MSVSSLSASEARMTWAQLVSSSFHIFVLSFTLPAATAGMDCLLET